MQEHFISYEQLGKMSFGELIKAIRKNKHMTYQDIAEKLNNPCITEEEIKEYEEMDVIVPREVLKPLSGILGVSYNDLLIVVGYNSVDPVIHYYTPEGKEINLYEIIAKIFYRDPSVLPHLYEIVFGDISIRNETIKVEGRKKRLEGIGFLVEKVQILRYIDDRQLSEIIMVKENEIKEICYLEDSEISTELLFRLHYVATLLFEKPYLENFDRNQVEKLKKACEEELSKRSNI